MELKCDGERGSCKCNDGTHCKWEGIEPTNDNCPCDWEGPKRGRRNVEDDLWI